MKSPIHYIQMAPRIASAALADPGETCTRLFARFADIQGHRRGHCQYVADGQWEQKLHASIDRPWPCPETSEFWSLWPSVIETLTSRGLTAGPAAFGVSNDGEPELVRAIWCLTRHLRPENVVETGVARGVTSRFILEALERNGSGRLWSIDLPPLLEPQLRAQIGVAVGSRFAHRWSLLEGSSRRRLPELLARLGQVDIFIHDSAHTERNVRFEIEQACRAIRPGGTIVVDDIDLNWSFREFSRTSRGFEVLVCQARPLKPDPRRFDGKGLFGAALLKSDGCGRGSAG
jgi:predicted O-methyltransferase YrrM